jgi:hypothetical protein
MSSSLNIATLQAVNCGLNLHPGSIEHVHVEEHEEHVLGGVNVLDLLMGEILLHGVLLHEDLSLGLVYKTLFFLQVMVEEDEVGYS